MDLDPYNWEIILTWNEKINKYKDPVYTFKVRDKEIKMPTHTESLSHSQIPKIAYRSTKGRYSTLVFTGKCSWRISVHAGLYPFKRGRRSFSYVCR
jgi:methylmalonyl-CoA mutase